MATTIKILATKPHNKWQAHHIMRLLLHRNTEPPSTALRPQAHTANGDFSLWREEKRPQNRSLKASIVLCDSTICSTILVFYQRVFWTSGLFWAPSQDFVASAKALHEGELLSQLADWGHNPKSSRVNGKGSHITAGSWLVSSFPTLST